MFRPLRWQRASRIPYLFLFESTFLYILSRRVVTLWCLTRQQCIYRTIVLAILPRYGLAYLCLRLQFQLYWEASIQKVCCLYLQYDVLSSDLPLLVWRTSQVTCLKIFVQAKTDNTSVTWLKELDILTSKSSLGILDVPVLSISSTVVGSLSVWTIGDRVHQTKLQTWFNLSRWHRSQKVFLLLCNRSVGSC
jgi:hypothetical protein